MGEDMEFNVEETTKRIIEDIKKYYMDNHAKGAIIGISGGKDSAVVASLMVKAIGKDNVIGLWLPCNSKESDKKDAYEISKSLGIRLIEHDLTKVYKDIVNDSIKNASITKLDLLSNSNINIKPRLRMNILYYYSAYYTSLYNSLYLVCGTSNKSELFVGYFTKGGDSVYDIAPIKHLYVDEVIQIGDYLNMVPTYIIHKAPDDGLSGQTDEEKLGFSYDDVKKVSIEMETGIKDSSLDDETRNKILRAHKINQHKFNVQTFRR